MRYIIGTIIWVIISFAASDAAAQDTPKCYKVDPYGLIQAEELDEITPCLRACVADRSCPETLSAQFWVIIDEIAEFKIERGLCYWSFSKNGQASHVFTPIEKSIDRLPSDMARVPNWDDFANIEPFLQAGTPFIDLNFSTEASSCTRYSDKVAIRRAFEALEILSSSGSDLADNELGYFYLTQPGFFDPDKARFHLERCTRDGDPHCLFNLARLDTLTSEDNCGNCIPLLRQTVQGSNDPGFNVALQLAELLFAGREQFYPVKDEGNSLQWRVSEVSSLFPAWWSLLEDAKSPVPVTTAKSTHSP